MCLYTIASIPHIARKEIIVYKQVDDNLKSPCYGFQYEIGKEYDLRKSLKFERTSYEFLYEINEGFHAFTSRVSALNHSDTFGYKRWNRYSNHASGDGTVVLECCIPIGAEFVINKLDDKIVSNKIIINKIYYKI